MEITFENVTLNGKVTTKPVYEDLKRYLICTLFSDKYSTINNVLLDKETKEILDILKALGANITIKEYAVIVLYLLFQFTFIFPSFLIR